MTKLTAAESKTVASKELVNPSNEGKRRSEFLGIFSCEFTSAGPGGTRSPAAHYTMQQTDRRNPRQVTEEFTDRNAEKTSP